MKLLPVRKLINSSCFSLANWTQILAIGVTSLLLRIYVPAVPYYTAAHDDFLMVSMANNILNGQWLGDYSELTHRALSKGPGYSMFIAWTHFLPWSPVVTVHILLLAGALFCLFQLAALGMNRKLVIPSFLFISFFPVWFGDSMSRIYRDGFLTACVFTATGSIVLLNKLISISHSRGRINFQQIISLAFAGAVFGLTVSISFITKNTVYPLVLLGVTVSVQILIKHFSKVTTKTISIFFLSAFVAFQPLTMFIKHENQTHYGVSVIENYYSGSFARTLKLMSAVSPVSDKRYVAVTKYARQNMYAASPTLRKLQPWLEGKPGEGWRAASCASPMKICDESGAWFPWELRDASELAGLANSATAFEVTFQDIYNELITACRTNQLNCSKSAIVPGFPMLSNVPIRDVLESTSETVSSIWNLNSAQKGSNSFYEGLDQKVISAWKNTIHDLPLNEPLPIYKSMQGFGVSTINLLRSVYSILWQFLILICLVAFLAILSKGFRRTSKPEEILVSLIGSATCAVFIVSILEAGLGGYLTIGGNLYTLGIYPLVLLMIPIALSELLSRFQEWIKVNRAVPGTCNDI